MIIKKLSLFKDRLTTVGSEEPLNKLSLAVIILLDIFVLNILFIGLSEHTRQITSPAEYMPQITREIFIDQTWAPSARLSKLQPLVLSDRKNYSYHQESIFDESALKKMHPLCRDFYEKVKTLSKDKALRALFVERDLKTSERRRVESSQDKAKNAYDTALLETIANKDSANTRSIATRSKNLTSRVEELTGEISTIDRTINAHPGIQELWSLVSPKNQNRQAVVDDYRRFEKWYPVRELGWQLLFMLPIFGLFYAWSAHSVKRDNRIQTMFASHMLVIASLPIICKVVELVIDLIPNYFFRNLFKFLKSLHLMALWHYVVIIGSIALGLFLVFLIQKKVFNKQKMMQKRLMNGACIRCSKKLPAGASICPFCGTKQLEVCSNCHEKTPIGGVYCLHCGTDRTQAN
ncbi:MAG: zinc ribbon domain-containing protein [Verrucomicrobia bacterium]|nr:zinc ribbon domain-containing protein [Verrucomicrobiota bacterium]